MDRGTSRLDHFTSNILAQFRASGIDENDHEAVEYWFHTYYPNWDISPILFTSLELPSGRRVQPIIGRMVGRRTNLVGRG